VKIKNPNYSQAAAAETLSTFAENLRLDLEKLRSCLVRMSEDNWKTATARNGILTLNKSDTFTTSVCLTVLRNVV
jgi:hypothetical protein